MEEDVLTAIAPAAAGRARSWRARLTVAIALGVCVGGGTATAFAAGPSGYFKDVRERLIFLQLRGVEWAQLHVASTAGHNAEVAAEILRLGGRIRFRADDVDYLRAVVPLRDPRALDAIAGLPTVVAVGLALSGEFPLSERPTDPTPVRHAAAPEPTVPLTDPHPPSRDVDGDDFQVRHPTYDGRGVVIALIERLPDVLHPCLQEARDLAGRVRSKFAGLERLSDPEDDRWDANWVRMQREVRASGGGFSVDGRAYRTSRDGSFRFGLVARPPLFRAARPLVPLAGQAANEPADIPVLWDEAADTVWVDTNLDGSFADERELRPQGDIGVFGRDDPSTPEREAVGFTVSVDRKARAVRVNVACGSHATMVSGVLAGHNFPGGKFQPLAGAARLWVYEYAENSYNIVESVYTAMANPDVDLVVLESNSVGFGYNGLTFGRSVAGIVLDRISDRFDKLLFATGNNITALGQVDEEAIGRHTIAVGAWDSRESLRTNAASDSAYADNLSALGSFGPSGNGRLKPDLVAPALQVSLEEMVTAPVWRIPGRMALPRGFTMAGGSSGSTPTAAAAAAALISGAKQAGLRHDATRLRAALFASARPLVGIPMYQQGRGTIQVGRAWDILQALDRTANLPAAIDAVAPVATRLAGYADPPGTGDGLFEREGWRAGEERRRVLSFVRRSGPAAPVTYVVEWQGDREAFRSAASLTLPRGETVELPVTVRPTMPGVSSAILRLRESTSAVEAFSMLNTVVATERQEASVLATSRTIRRPGVDSLFVEVSPQAMTLRVAMSNRGPVPIGLRVASPGLPTDPLWNAGMINVSAGEAGLSIPFPTPGVWEILLNNRSRVGPGEDALTQLPLRVEEFGIDPGQAAKTAAGWEISCRNRGAPIQGGIAWSSFAEQQEVSGHLGAGERRMFDLTVPPGTKYLRLECEVPAVAGTDVGLLLYQYDRGRAVLRWQSGARGAPLATAIVDPAPGKWKVVIDPFCVPRDGTAFRYRALLARDALGAVHATSDRVEAGTNEVVRIQAVGRLDRSVPPGRYFAVFGLSSVPGASVATGAAMQRSLGIPVYEGLVEIIAELN